LIVLAIVVLLLSAVLGRAWLAARNEQLVEQALEPEIPLAIEADAVASGGPGRVVLHLRSGEFYIKPAEPGESLQVKARYDERSYELQERFEPGETGWVYDLDFRGTETWWMVLLKGLVGGEKARVDVFLPTDVPLELVVDGAQGGAIVDLGGLWLTQGDVEWTQGGLVLDVREPLRKPIESFTIHGSMGGCVATRLGNLSPSTLDVDWRMGGLELDLRGEWVTDSDVSIHIRQGGGNVRLPRGVDIVGLAREFGGLREEAELPRPTLTFSVSSEQGNLEFSE
jgi:hypothetical protein